MRTLFFFGRRKYYSKKKKIYSPIHTKLRELFSREIFQKKKRVKKVYAASYITNEG